MPMSTASTRYSELNRLYFLKEMNQLDESSRLYCTTSTIQADLQSKKTIQADLLTLAAQEDAIWCHRCKVKWLNEGDENKAFFHRLVAANKRRNFMAELERA